MQKNLRRNRRARAARRRRKNLMVSIFVMAFILVGFIVLRATLALAYESIDLTSLAKVEFEGFNEDGSATVTVDDEAVDELMASVKKEHESSWFSTEDIEDGDYAKFRQSLSFSLPRNTGLSNGDIIPVLGACDESLAKKLKIDINSNSNEITVNGLLNVTKLSLDEVFESLNVTFDGISPSVTVALQNTSTQPLVSKMIFEIVDAKEFYSEGDVVRIHAKCTEDMCRETGYIVDAADEECVRDYVVTSDSEYISRASDLPSNILKEAIEAGKKAFTDANEYGVRIFCEANLVPVYINKKATFSYGSPNYVSSYFKSVFPEKAGELGLAYNDLDIIYDVKISQADGVGCTAYGAVRFSDIIKHSDGSYSYDFSSPQLLSVSYFSARVKKNVVDSYANSYNIDRVSP